MVWFIQAHFLHTSAKVKSIQPFICQKMTTLSFPRIHLAYLGIEPRSITSVTTFSTTYLGLRERKSILVVPSDSG